MVATLWFKLARFEIFKMCLKYSYSIHRVIPKKVKHLDFYLFFGWGKYFTIKTWTCVLASMHSFILVHSHLLARPNVAEIQKGHRLVRKWLKTSSNKWQLVLPPRQSRCHVRLSHQQHKDKTLRSLSDSFLIKPSLAYCAQEWPPPFIISLTSRPQHGRQYPLLSP